MGARNSMSRAIVVLMSTSAGVTSVSAHQVRLEPGTALLINNRKGLHARSQFSARYDGRDRWLQRAFVHADHRRSRHLRAANGNILT